MTARRAFAAGVRVTGCTVHLVEDAVDAGPVADAADLADLMYRLGEAP